MTSKELYKQFLLKTNKLDTNENIHVPPGIFVLLFNEQVLSWLSEKIVDYKKTDSIFYLNSLHKSDIETPLFAKDSKYTDYSLPQDYFHVTASRTLASKGNCKATIYNQIAKPKKINSLLANSFSVPSFEWEEGLSTVTDKHIRVYHSDFSIENHYIDYYRKPTSIDLEGYVKVDNTSSTTIDPDIPDELLIQILNRTTLEAIRIYENPDGYQLRNETILKEKQTL